MIGGVAGITSDANSLVNYARTVAQRHLLQYNEDIPVELLAQRLCDMKQGYTQYGGASTSLRARFRSFHSASFFLGLRPFGVSILYAGYDPHYRFQLYHSDPSGNYSGWKATCIGANNGTAQSLLKQEYKDNISVDEAIGLVLRVMSRTMDSTTLGSEKCQSHSVSSVLIIVLIRWRSARAHVVEFAVLTYDEAAKQPKAKIYKPSEIDALLKAHDLAKKDEDTEMKS